jgi:hypothetical protein
MERKTRRLEIRLTEQEYALLMAKAAHYPNRTKMIVEAVRALGDMNMRERQIALKAMTDLYCKYRQDLAWMGGNFNQVVKRANELAIGQQLTVPFFEQVLFPQIKELQALLESIKREQHDIAKRLTKGQ